MYGLRPRKYALTTPTLSYVPAVAFQYAQQYPWVNTQQAQPEPGPDPDPALDPDPVTGRVPGRASASIRAIILYNNKKPLAYQVAR